MFKYHKKINLYKYWSKDAYLGTKFMWIKNILHKKKKKYKYLYFNRKLNEKLAEKKLINFFLLEKIVKKKKKYVKGLRTGWKYIKGRYVKGKFIKGRYVKGSYVKGKYVKGHYIKGYFEKSRYIKGFYKNFKVKKTRNLWKINKKEKQDFLKINKSILKINRIFKYQKLYKMFKKYKFTFQTKQFGYANLL